MEKANPLTGRRWRSGDQFPGREEVFYCYDARYDSGTRWFVNHEAYLRNYRMRNARRAIRLSDPIVGPSLRETCRLQSSKNNKKLRKKGWHKKYYRRPLAKMSISLRNRVNVFIRREGKEYCVSTSKVLGCSWETFCLHMESLFQDGMNWDNHGVHGWHIDHIIPLSSAGSKHALEALCHYTNLRPLWAFDNLSKHAKISE